MINMNDMITTRVSYQMLETKSVFWQDNMLVNHAWSGLLRFPTDPLKYCSVRRVPVLMSWCSSRPRFSLVTVFRSNVDSRPNCTNTNNSWGQFISFTHCRASCGDREKHRWLSMRERHLYLLCFHEHKAHLKVLHFLQNRRFASLCGVSCVWTKFPKLWMLLCDFDERCTWLNDVPTRLLYRGQHADVKVGRVGREKGR